MRIKHISIFTFFLLFMLSCSKKNVQLPLIDSDGISEIYNHSSIWLFFEKNGTDTLAVLNKNNKIINTHWIFNIDRHLPMKYVVPNLIEIQNAKHKPSMHRKEGTYIYYSFANTKSNKISLIEFTPTNFVLSNNRIKDTIAVHQWINIDIQKENVYINKKKSELDQLKKDIENFKSEDSLHPSKIILKYCENTSFQKYLQTKMILSKINMVIDSTEYIYSLK